MLTRCLSLALVLAASGAKAAALSPAAAFGNTIVSTYPDGRVAELWLKEDGGYSAKGRRGDGSSGHWRVKGARLCLKQSRPLPMFFSFCTAIPDAAKTWTAKAVTGETISVRLVKGIVSGHATGKAGPGGAARKG